MLMYRSSKTAIMGKMSMTFQLLFDSLYPPVCPVCQKVLPVGMEKKVRIHSECLNRLKRVREPLCKKCGKPVASKQQEYCYDCTQQKRSFEAGHGLWIYDANSAASIFAYKYHRRPEFAAFYAQSLIRYYGQWMRSLNVQQIIPVPVSRQKLRQRGFNQAGLLADDLGEALGCPVNGGGLVRIHGTTPQKELGKNERRKNLEKAFKAGTGLEGIRRVLLVDDIYTTGSTIEYCTRALRAAGVEKVWFMTLCIGAKF